MPEEAAQGPRTGNPGAAVAHDAAGFEMTDEGLNRREFLALAALAVGGMWLGAAAPVQALPAAATLGAVAWCALEHPPAGWMFCEGQKLPIRQHMALYSLLGTRYGGDGRTTFCLPDCRDPARPGFHQGFGPQCPLKAIICTMGVFPERA